MKLEIEIPDSKEDLQYYWKDGFEIETEMQDGEFVLSANRTGLISLAVQLLTLAQDEFSVGHHFHYDTHGCLEENSINMIIMKK